MPSIFDAAPMNLISDFTGSDENPLSEGGNWANLSTSGSPSAPLKRVSNTAASSSGTGASYWTPANFGPDLEAYVTIPGPGGPSQSSIGFRIQGEGGAATWDGYLVSTNGAVAEISVVTNGSRVTTSFAVSPSWALGDKIGARAEGSTIQVWKQTSGSSDWNLVGMLGTSTYPSAGKIALISASPTVSMDDFYAGTINAVPVA